MRGCVPQKNNADYLSSWWQGEQEGEKVSDASLPFQTSASVRVLHGVAKSLSRRIKDLATGVMFKFRIILGATIVRRTGGDVLSFTSWHSSFSLSVCVQVIVVEQA